jgi:hypothetical protein
MYVVQLSQQHLAQSVKSVAEVEADVALREYREENYMDADEPVPKTPEDVEQYYKYARRLFCFVLFCFVFAFMVGFVSFCLSFDFEPQHLFVAARCCWFDALILCLPPTGCQRCLLTKACSARQTTTMTRLCSAGLLNRCGCAPHSSACAALCSFEIATQRIHDTTWLCCLLAVL